MTAHSPALILTAGLIGQGLACFALFKSVSDWRRDKRPADLAVAVTSGVWLLELLASTLLPLFDADPATVATAVFVGAQALTLCVGLLLVTCANAVNRRVQIALLVHLIAGLAALTWYLAGPQELRAIARTNAYWSWIAINLLGIALLSVFLAAAARYNPTQTNRLALAASLLGLLLWIDGLYPPDQLVLTVTFTQSLYAAFLIVVWQSGKQRVACAASNSPSSIFESSTGFEPLSGMAPGSEEAAHKAVAMERRRIAQDLHDNVGSQIVNILASLDTRGSQSQQQVGLALEQCLLDLKLTVDAIDSATDNVPEALGRLRERIQHVLDTRGTKLLWKVQICDELEAARGWIAVQVLRIAQESLTNVLRHSGATLVEVVCRYGSDAGEIVLEVRDNGRGIERDRRHAGFGKGLDGMRRRAKAAGGSLVISSKVGSGTRVRLTLPFCPPMRGWPGPAHPNH